MDEEVNNDKNDRSRIISELSDYIHSMKEKLDDILKRFDFTEDFLDKNREMGVCRVNPAHRVPVDKLDQHLNICLIVQKYKLTRTEAEQLLEVQPFYKNDSIILDDESKKRVLNDAWQSERLKTRPSDDLDNLTAEERTVIDEHIISISQSKIPRVDVDESLSLTAKQILKRAAAKEPASEAELLQLYRDSKRRRATYRAKNVHITQKSYTEIIREVLANQMELLAENEDEKQNSEDEDRYPRKRDGQKRNSKRSRSRSQDRRSRSPSKRRSRSRSPSGPRSQSRRSRSRSPSRRSSHHRHKKHKKHRHGDKTR